MSNYWFVAKGIPEDELNDLAQVTIDFWQVLADKQMSDLEPLDFAGVVEGERMFVEEDSFRDPPHLIFPNLVVEVLAFGDMLASIEEMMADSSAVVLRVKR